MEERIFRAGGRDYVFDSVTERWLCDGKLKNTHILGSINVWPDENRTAVAMGLLSGKEEYQDKFSSALIVGNCALGISDKSLVQRIEPNALVVSALSPDISMYLTGPIEEIYKPLPSLC